MAKGRDPFPFIPQGHELLRRVMLAELLGPPRSRERRPPLVPPPPAPTKAG